VTHETQELLAFVRQLPVGMAYAPIYAAGKQLQSGKASLGKTPFERSHHQVMTPADVALQIERRPDVFRAVGVFTGPRSAGLVILDVDRNLSRLKKKWGDSLEGAPVVTSTKANAAKYLFRVPEELWPHVQGFGLSDTGAGYEVLWQRQGLLYGLYPGSSDGKAPEGFYGFEGDLEAIPQAPDWLIAEMKDRAGKEVSDGGFIKNRKALDFSDRDPAEVAEIIQSALRVIPGQGRNSRDHWIKVGMAIHSELPNDLGLTLWSAWSAKDPEFADEWVSSNPCEEVWKSFKKGPVTLGSLFWMADQQMPARRWLPEDLQKIVEDAEQDRVQRIRSIGLPHEEIIRRATAAMKLPNPSEVQHKLHEIGLEAGYKDATAVVRLVIADQEYRRGSQGGSLSEIFATEDSPIEYLIPDLLPKPGTVLMHGRGGCGKTMAVMTLAKHIARGLPFSVRGQDVPVEQGTVLWLNGDQNSRRIRKQFEELDFNANDPVIVRNKVSMLWYPWFIQQIEEHRPKLVVWDSVTACMRGCAFDQNKAEYAEPLYWYSSENGESFPATTIVFIHHANKEGGFRGTTALEDGVDESWSIRRPEKAEKERVGASARLITINKSREGNEGKQLVLRQQADLTFELKDLPSEDANSDSPASIVDRVLHRLRTRGVPMTRRELNADPLVGGSVEGIRKALDRLVDRGLVAAEGKGSSKQFQAVVSHTRGGVDLKPVQKEEEPSAGAGSDEKTCPDLSGSVRFCPDLEPELSVFAPEADGMEPENGQAAQKPDKNRTKADKNGQPETLKALRQQGSEENGHETGGLFTREERTREEMDRLMQEAADLWS
jgi:hypothetical protein